jgi:hypothetical protein
LFQSTQNQFKKFTTYFSLQNRIPLQSSILLSLLGNAIERDLGGKQHKMNEESKGKYAKLLSIGPSQLKNTSNPDANQSDPKWKQKS